MEKEIGIASIVIASVSLLVAVFSFLINYIFSQIRLFYDVYTNYINNDEAQKACREINKGLIKQDVDKYPFAEVHLDQFLIYINTLSGISNSYFVKKHCRGLIEYEINLIKSNEFIVKYASVDGNHLDNLKKII